MSNDIWRPLMAMVKLAAWRLGKPVVFIVDIDFRSHSWLLRQLGIWSLKSYIVNRLFHAPLRWLQVWIAPHVFDLVLLKSPNLVRDFGRGLPHVRNFFDTVHSAEQIVSDKALQRRLKVLRNPDKLLRLAYFGRLPTTKGWIDQSRPFTSPELMAMISA